jgi:hypothetical protein
MITRRMMPPIASKAAGVIAKKVAIGAITGMIIPDMIPKALNKSHPTVYLKLSNPCRAAR